ncbi:hypothetical protein ACFIOY_30750 [Bradyrhizobium sp. TZ2]
MASEKANVTASTIIVVGISEASLERCHGRVAPIIANEAGLDKSDKVTACRHRSVAPNIASSSGALEDS